MLLLGYRRRHAHAAQLGEITDIRICMDNSGLSHTTLEQHGERVQQIARYFEPTY
jgi:hypothetical protein